MRIFHNCSYMYVSWLVGGCQHPRCGDETVDGGDSADGHEYSSRNRGGEAVSKSVMYESALTELSGESII